MENTLDLSALAAIGGSSSGPLVFALRNNVNLERTKSVAASADTGSTESIDLRPDSEASRPTIAFNRVPSASEVRTLAELTRFAAREEENRTRIQEHLQSLENSVTNIQRARSFMLTLTTAGNVR